MLIQRVIPGILLALFWVLLLFLGSPLFFSLVITGIVLLAVDEYVCMVHNQSELTVVRRFFCDVVFLLPVVATIIYASSVVVYATTLLAFFLIVLWHVVIFKSDGIFAQAGFQHFCFDTFGLFYIGMLASHICLIHHLPEGEVWLLIVSGITAGSDTGAYFSGKAFGQHKLSPSVSPNKTIEGAVGGIFVAVIVTLVFGFWLLQEPHFFFLVGIAVILSLLGILGDLTESIVKRGTGVKDSGTLLAGHGGVLDRIDSILFAVPALYYILHFFSSVLL